ncbi:hypothetical protein JKF63_01311 [Porcisia hertigi]|uniref:Uncharacterized protein n=1 Tax=Porcisia hertigi TaxID=2761500 RepID=A0A836I919_9TRYP|nr:hypothetical protein JKF63_01311 [Porcisia hertigi]
MGSRLNHRKTWAASVAVVTTLIALVVRRRRRDVLSKDTVAGATHAEVVKTLKHSLLPVAVLPEDLPAGWSVAPPVFYPPHCAAIPIVLPSEVHSVGDKSHPSHTATTSVYQDKANDSAMMPTIFIFCSYTGRTAGPFATRQDECVYLSELVAHHPVLRDCLVANLGQWSPLPELGPQTETSAASTTTAPKETILSTLQRAFSHVLIGDEYVILSGVNGPYLALAVLTGLAGKWSPSLAARAPTRNEKGCKKDSGSATSVPTAEQLDLSSAIEAMVRATVNVPLVALGGEPPALSPRLPGASSVVHQGYYRVVCTREGRELELCVPSEWRVRSQCVAFSPPTPSRSTAAGPNRVSTGGGGPELGESILTLSFTPSLFVSEGSVDVRVSAEVFSALFENPKAAAATLWEASGATEISNPVAKATLEAMTARPLPASSHARANDVTLVYVQPKLGVVFSVHPHSAVVYEPWMTDLPTILYYPFGDAAEDDEPPRMTIQHVAELPSTWEVLAGDDEEFVHNVLFHFTDEKRAVAVSTTLTEISGIRCAMFHEVREARRCRTYVLPRGATVLIVRWETLEDCWDRDLQVFQQTLDTLHIDALAISQ